MPAEPHVHTLAASDAAIAEAAAHLRAGRLVAFPTETVYGLGADATDGRAVAAIFAAKGRPSFNPLIVHVASRAAAEPLAELGEMARRLADEFWPGPLTLVLRKAPGNGLSDLVTAGLDTVALRVPDHPIAQALLRAAGCPVAAPSANRSGHVSATTAQHVAADFLAAAVALVLDGGPTAHGLESTVLDATGRDVVLLRPGAVTTEQIQWVTGRPVLRAHGTSANEAGEADPRPTSPGQLASHYAPRAAVRLNAMSAGPGDGLLGFGAAMPAHDGPAINLSPSGDLIEAASALFAALRKLDAAGVATIAVMPIPGDGLGEAINDRLARAAAGR